MLSSGRINHVVVLGAGLMGAQIGCEYLLGGHEVTLVARDLDAAAARLRQALGLAARLGLIEPGGIDAAMECAGLALEPGRDCDLVVESLPENLELKASILGPIAVAAPGAIVATNTSSLSITALGRAIGAPERTVGTHYWNPPLLMPLVELVAGDDTDAGVVERMRAVLEALGKRPLIVERDVPGFVWNRLQAAIMREALWLVENGVASPEAVDETMREGLARRWRHIGPFETAALGGAATWRQVGANLLPTLSTAQDLAGLDAWLPTDEATLAAARLRRDAALAEELLRERGRPTSSS